MRRQRTHISILPVHYQVYTASRHYFCVLLLLMLADQYPRQLPVPTDHWSSLSPCPAGVWPSYKPLTAVDVSVCVSLSVMFVLSACNPCATCVRLVCKLRTTKVLVLNEWRRMLGTSLINRESLLRSLQSTNLQQENVQFSCKISNRNSVKNGPSSFLSLKWTMHIVMIYFKHRTHIKRYLI